MTTTYLPPRHPDLLSRRELARYAAENTAEARQRLRADAEVRRNLEAAKETRCGCGGRCGCAAGTENAEREYAPPVPYWKTTTPKAHAADGSHASADDAGYMAPVPYHQDRRTSQVVNTEVQWPESFADRAALIQAACEELRARKMA